jgi:hypothetical protein
MLYATPGRFFAALRMTRGWWVVGSLRLCDGFARAQNIYVDTLAIGARGPIMWESVEKVAKSGEKWG